MRDIVLTGVSKAYGDHAVLKDLSMRFPAGGISCVTAPSGAGKTTLLRLLCGLETPDAGEIRGTEGMRFGMVFQEDRLLPWGSAAGNIRFANRRLSKAETGEAMRAVGLSEPDQPASELSGGMARRVALLRALLAENDVLLLDEPFKGLDEETRAQVIRFLLSSRNGRTVILVTHDPAEAAMMGAEVFPLPLPGEAGHGG